MTDIGIMFNNVDWEKVDTQEDYTDEIPALKGDYRGEIKKFGFIETDKGGFFSMNTQIIETVKGVKGVNRYVSKAFNLGQNEWSTEEENKTRLLVALKTIGATSPDEAVGKVVCLKIRPNIKDGKVKMDKNGWPKHFVAIVKEFKTPTDGVTPGEVSQDTKIPF